MEISSKKKCKKNNNGSEHKPQIGLMATRTEKRDRFRVKESEKKAMEVTLVSSKRRVVKTPVAKIIRSTISIPILDWKIKSDFHPMPLSFKISILWKVSCTRIRMYWNSYSHQKAKNSNGNEGGSDPFTDDPPPTIVFFLLLIGFLRFSFQLLMGFEAQTTCRLGIREKERQEMKVKIGRIKKKSSTHWCHRLPRCARSQVEEA